MLQLFEKPQNWYKTFIIQNNNETRIKKMTEIKDFGHLRRRIQRGSQPFQCKKQFSWNWSIFQNEGSILENKNG